MNDEYIAMSAMSIGPKRLRIKEIIRLKCKDVCTVFVPSFENKKDSKFVRDVRAEMLSVFRQVVLSELPDKWINTQCNDYFRDHLRSREMQREGRIGHQFHVCVVNYPEQQRMEAGFMTESEKNYLLDCRTDVGLNCQLIGYSTKTLALVKLVNLPYLEVYVARQSGDIILDEVQFPRTKKDEVLACFLANELWETRGDTIATLNILAEYFKMSTRTNGGKNVSRRSDGGKCMSRRCDGGKSVSRRCGVTKSMYVRCDVSNDSGVSREGKVWRLCESLFFQTGEVLIFLSCRHNSRNGGGCGTRRCRIKYDMMQLIIRRNR